MCPPRIDSHASWVPVAAGSADVVGTCDPGWEGAPTRSCDIIGNWGTMSGECIRAYLPMGLSALADDARQSCSALA